MNLRQSLTKDTEIEILPETDISNHISTIVGRIFSSKVFSDKKDTINTMLETYNISEDVYHNNTPLRELAGRVAQTEKQITHIPPEGILIDSPGTYTLNPSSSGDIKWKPNADVGAAITIVSDDVVLDLSGCTLNMKIQNSASHLVGIYVMGASKVTIKNGSLANACLYGIQAELVDTFTVQGVTVSGLEYSNKNIRNASPTGIQVNFAKNVSIEQCTLQYFYVTADTCSGIQLMNTISGKITYCNISNLINYAGIVEGFGYITSSDIHTTYCKANRLESHFGGNIRTMGHTVLGFLPVLCTDLVFDHCTASNIIGSCDDCHGMSIFFNKKIKVNYFMADTVTDGVTQFNTGAKATGLEVYGVDVQIKNSFVKNITAINSQDRQSAGFSVWGEDVEFLNCTATNVSVTYDLKDPDAIVGTGVGFGWAPDPRLYHTGAKSIKYEQCEANRCQVGFDTWNHIDSVWSGLTHLNCGINILVEPGGTRTVFGDPCTECNPPVTVTIRNQAKRNVFPGSQYIQSSIRCGYPTGNINGLSIPSALSRIHDVDSQWWFYVGLLHDSKEQDHSFELNFIEPGGATGDESVVAVDFDFSFADSGCDFHATSTFGGYALQNIIQSVENILGLAKVTASEDTYNLSVESSSGPNIQVEYSAEKSTSKTSMFTGKIGQPGAAFTIAGTGTTWLWKYMSNGDSECAPYQYKVGLELMDERGLVPEGQGSYVGIDPTRPNNTDAQSSVEYAQPRLRVIKWNIELNRLDEGWLATLWEQLEGFETSYCFEGSNEKAGHIWLDRQALFEVQSERRGSGRTAITSALSEAQKVFGEQRIMDAIKHQRGNEKKSFVAEHISKSALEDISRKQLYLGCWLPVVLTSGPYEGVTLLFVAFWKDAKSIANYDTDNGDAHANSFMNVYTGFINTPSYDTQSAYTLSDLLSPQEGPVESNNYRIHFTQQFEHIGHLSDPQRWAKEIKVTVKANTQSRFALAAYALRAGKQEQQEVGQDVTFTIKALSPYTNTTMLSPAFGAPIFEGASRVYSQEGGEVGTGWVEQMVGDPK